MNIIRRVIQSNNIDREIPNTQIIETKIKIINTHITMTKLSAETSHKAKENIKGIMFRNSH